MGQLIQIASGAGSAVRYVKEVTLGETPASPAMKEIDNTGCSLVISRDTLTSNAIRSDRQIPFNRTSVDKVGGGLGFELCAGEYDDFLEAALAGTWTDDKLKAGKALHMFTIERAFDDIEQYGVFTGCAFNQMTLSVQPSAIITGNFEMVGLSATYNTAPLSATPTPIGDASPFDSFTGSLKVDAGEIAVVTGIELSLQNGIDPKFPLFTRSAKAVTMGKSNLSGSLSAFFTPDALLLEKFLQDKKAVLEFTLKHGDYSYDFLIPNVTLTGADNPVQSEGEITLNVPWQAALDTTLGSNIQITRHIPTP